MLCCCCCGNVFTNEVADPMFVCDQCDAERLEAYLEEIRDEEPAWVSLNPRIL